MQVKQVSFGYEVGQPIFAELNVAIPKGKITTIIGPNGCGKSTLLGLLTKAYSAKHGEIVLEERNIKQIKRKAFARQVAVLHQHNNEELSLTVRELVANGRVPYEGNYSKVSKEADSIIEWALERTKLIDLQDRPLDTLSGGQRQRAWLAMALCQQPDYLFLDEPTTYLDMYYQIELLELVQELNKEYNMTVVMVLHDINQALNYSDHVIVMKKGQVIRVGKPIDVIDESLIEEVYNIKGKIYKDGLAYYLLPYSS